MKLAKHSIIPIENAKMKAETAVRVLKRHSQEGLVGFAERLADQYTKTCDIEIRKMKGQFFTPGRIGRFMANMFTAHN